MGGCSLLAVEPIAGSSCFPLPESRMEEDPQKIQLMISNSEVGIINSIVSLAYVFNLIMISPLSDILFSVSFSGTRFVVLVSSFL